MIFFDWRFWGKSLFFTALFILALVVSTDSPASPVKAELIAHSTDMERKYDLPPGLLTAICEQETHWRNVSGAHGEIGVCQIQAATVKMICSSCVGNASRTVFQLGSRGAQVLEIQTALKERGLYSGPLDGIFGPVTQRAVLTFQQFASLPADAVVGPATWRSLLGTPYPGRAIAESLWNPKENIEWAARFLVWLRDNVSDEPLILMAAYNGGPANPTVRYMLSVSRKRGVL